MAIFASYRFWAGVRGSSRLLLSLDKGAGWAVGLGKGSRLAILLMQRGGALHGTTWRSGSSDEDCHWFCSALPPPRNALLPCPKDHNVGNCCTYGLPACIVASRQCGTSTVLTLVVRPSHSLTGGSEGALWHHHDSSTGSYHPRWAWQDWALSL